MVKFWIVGASFQLLRNDSFYLVRDVVGLISTLVVHVDR